MRRWSYRLLALLLLWMIVPGAVEATENLAHVLKSGHLAHAAENGDSHSESGPEHGCNGTFHLCSCHVTPVGLLATAAIPAGAGSDAQCVDGLADGLYSAHLHNIEHPPQI